MKASFCWLKSLQGIGGGWNLQSHETSYLITLPLTPWLAGSQAVWPWLNPPGDTVGMGPLATSIHWHPVASTGSKFGSIRIYPHPQHHYVFMPSFRPLRLGLLFVH